MLRSTGRFIALGRSVRGAASSLRLLAVRPALRGFADEAESHSDFAPKAKAVTDADLLASLAKIVKDHKVVLFMKGTPEQPMCGFSAKVVKLLHMNGAEIHAVDVLQSPSLRSTLKEFSSWPTFPQLYINGEFIGGCDITTQLHAEGELAKMLK